MLDAALGGRNLQEPCTRALTRQEAWHCFWDGVWMLLAVCVVRGVSTPYANKDGGFTNPAQQPPDSLQHGAPEHSVCDAVPTRSDAVWL